MREASGVIDITITEIIALFLLSQTTQGELLEIYSFLTNFRHLMEREDSVLLRCHIQLQVGLYCSMFCLQ